MNMFNQGQLLLPVLALAGWTFAILLQIPYRRFRAVFKGELNQEDFALGESRNVSNYVALANRNYMNLLELPILFYLACLTFYLLEAGSSVSLGLAWAYVLLRCAHSLVHITYNKVSHRLMLFALSNFVLMGMWLLLIGPILNAST